MVKIRPLSQGLESKPSRIWVVLLLWRTSNHNYLHLANQQTFPNYNLLKRNNNTSHKFILFIHNFIMKQRFYINSHRLNRIFPGSLIIWLSHSICGFKSYLKSKTGSIIGEGINVNIHGICLFRDCGGGR